MSNPPAFPQTHSLQHNLTEVFGMTLRDYFAAAIAQGIMANPDWQGDVSGTAFKIADDMLRERNTD